MATLASGGRRTGMRGRHGLRWAAVAVAVTGALARPAAGADAGQVEQALNRGRDYLLAAEKDGNWEVVQTPDPAIAWQPSSVCNGQWGGTTAIATLALLASGVDANDPHVKSAVAFLRKAEIKGNYALALRAQVWNAIPPEPWVRQAELADARQLEGGLRLAKGETYGFYGYLTGGYPPPPPLPGDPPRPPTPPAAVPLVGTDYDHSVSQFAVLGMWALEQAGVEVPGNYWQVVDTAWHRQQWPEGGWAYKAKPKVVTSKTYNQTLSMTAAGVATLFITQEMLTTAARCNGNPDDPAIDAGLKYLGGHLAEVNPNYKFYTLFAVSRVGLASGYKYLGGTDWFQWGVDQSVVERPKAGYWLSASGVPDVSFALLFLARARAPVMLNKLRYDVAAGTGRSAKAVPGTWNQRPRDAANLCRWVGRQIESPLNWQVVGLNEPAEDLHDAPILYLAGGKAPRLSDADAAKLRGYAEDGGLVLGHADCGSADFAKGFKALGEQMFPGRKFRPLEPTSPIYTNQTFPAAGWKSARPAVEALSNGTRELMVLLPAGDPARLWQSQSFRPIKTDVFGQLVIDLFLYAVDKQGLRRRGETYRVARNDGRPAAQVAARVARLRYAGNWDPEPGGWRRLANVLHNAGVAELTTAAVDGPIDPSCALASLTVAAADAKLTDAQRSAVRDYVKGGGTLLVDVAGGRSLYRAAAEAELAKLFPDAPRDLPVLPATDPVFAAAGPPLAARTVDYRRFDRPGGNPHAPQLRAYAVAGRPAVFYSREDLSVGLVGQPIDGVAGYAPADATKVVADVVAYAAKSAKR